MSEQPPLAKPPHPYPGKLIIVEGIDGSGKSTQLLLLHKWLESKGHRIFFTEWNSSELVKDTTKRGKKTKSLTPTTFSLLHATDFASRFYHDILPPLKPACSCSPTGICTLSSLVTWFVACLPNGCARSIVF